ncbi:MAG: FKBP-type peptidyl-prolyl cis-trans isomerase [Nitrospirota bacterium]
MARTRVKAKNGDKVKITYTCSLSEHEKNEVLIGQETLEFILGNSEVIKGIDEAVNGMKVGESKTMLIPAEKAYGAYHQEWVLDVGRDRFPEDWNPEVGLYFEIPRENGQTSTAIVRKVSRSSVMLDFNHPLAGKDLLFDLALLEIVKS